MNKIKTIAIYMATAACIQAGDWEGSFEFTDAFVLTRSSNGLTFYSDEVGEVKPGESVALLCQAQEGMQLNLTIKMTCLDFTTRCLQTKQVTKIYYDKETATEMSKLFCKHRLISSMRQYVPDEFPMTIAELNLPRPMAIGVLRK